MPDRQHVLKSMEAEERRGTISAGGLIPGAGREQTAEQECSAADPSGDQLSNR